jgi:hypothetical protein
MLPLPYPSTSLNILLHRLLTLEFEGVQRIIRKKKAAIHWKTEDQEETRSPTTTKASLSSRPGKLGYRKF